MNIHVIDQNTICITTETMPTAEQILDAFLSCGMTPDGEVLTTAFVGKTGVLVFAALIPKRVIYRFETLESIIGGAQAICATCASPTGLYYYDGAYFLTLSEDFVHLAEFGNAEENPALTGACLEEYGEVLCRKDAVRLLSSVFHT